MLDLGSGLGRHAARMAALGAKVPAVDSSPTQHQRAAARYPGAPGLSLVCAGAVAHLRTADPYDLVYSVREAVVVAGPVVVSDLPPMGWRATPGPGG
ncbi:class I SAM-dependent methyltransferase [Streptomyces sp. NPDC006368]|uniref:class I SAM-dependent methyltransferase n=1 Tax=Streptomyces sp. NPDC006368 TaxID=3156760 RepID=UPI0033B029C9